MEEIEEPTGKFVLDNLPFEKRFQTANGLYIHYADVCTLLKKYHETKVKNLRLANVSHLREQLLAFTSQLNQADITQIEIAEYELVVDAFLKSQ